MTYLARSGFKIFFDHLNFHDIRGMTYDRGDGDWLITPDAPVKSFSTIQAQRSRNPKPSLTENF